MGTTNLTYDAKGRRDEGAIACMNMQERSGNLTTDRSGNTLVWDIDRREATLSNCLSAAKGTTNGRGNHLKEVNDGDAATIGSYTYDAIDRRVSKTVGATTTVYVCAGDQVLSEYDNGTLTRSYVYGSYIDDALAMIETAGVTYYHRDRQFNTIGLTNSTGAVVEMAAYTPYGDLTITDALGSTLPAPSSSNRYYYTGRYLDDESGLWYFRARYMIAMSWRHSVEHPDWLASGTCG